MTFRVVPPVCVSALLLLAQPAVAQVRVGWLSQQITPDEARIGASIHASERVPGRPAPPSPSAGGGTSTPAGVPTLPSTSPLLQRTHPVGPGSFWYTTLDGQRCVYVATGPGPCYRVTPGGGGPAQPPVDPAVVAAAAARRLALVPGTIRASPSAREQGLTGASSWFWLDPPPSSRSVSVSVGRQRVTVTAAAKEVRWTFGDGSSLTGGPGVPYRSGAAPDRAIRHRYRTRCLPGDQGHHPYVLASCRARGYTVTAELAWGISYEARGPVSETGGLPSRTTATSVEYPVSEARGFLTAGGAG
jgi:hypothetical protein